MNGAGNDFILVDNRDGSVRLTNDQIIALCDRHRGIGADGIILLIPCGSKKADWAWDFYNNDGSSGEMCGNGARCFARFVQKLTGAAEKVTFETLAGIIESVFRGEQVTVNLTEPKDLALDFELPLSMGPQKANSVNTGVPHAVLFVPDADKAMITELGPEIRRHKHFGTRGTNVNFAQVLGEGRIRVRTFERGVEAETLACGTGVTASALIASSVHNLPSPVKVRVQGGDELEVSFEKTAEGFKNVRLTGPAEFVFEGRINI